MTLSTEWNNWKSIIEDRGVTVCHSSQDEITVHNVKDYYDADETGCEEDWANYQGYVTETVEDILNGNVDINSYELDECLNSFINGQFSQFENQFNELEDQSEFLSHINGDPKQIDILETIINFYI